ncbi:MAG: hypothetical protein D4R64_10675 [Porphyromonadaceae bacterium]|nr:MAG: hypothetical protein D4R64_10675 [Porphyromonadaceae bacterium]
MNIKMKYFGSKLIGAVIVLSVVFTIAYCSKDDTSKTALITSKTWVIESVNMAGMDLTAAEILTDEGSEYQMTLKGDGTLTFTDNMGLNPATGMWQFQANETQFKVYGIDATSSDLNTITKLTATELWFWHMDGSDKMIMHYKVK